MDAPLLPHGANGLDLGDVVIEFRQETHKIIALHKTSGDHYTMQAAPRSGIIDVHRTWRDQDGTTRHQTLFAMHGHHLVPLLQELSWVFVQFLRLARRLRMGWLHHRHITIVRGLEPTAHDEIAAVRGLPHVETTHPAENQNGIAVFSRTPMRRTRPCPAPSAGLVRWLDIDLPEYGFGIGVLHVMAAGSSKKHPTNVAKTRFWEVVLQAAESRLQEPFLFVGDWNTGAHRLDETGKTFVCAEHFGRLSTLGWTDMWRHHNPGVTEWTWYSKLKGGARGNGFRLDHAFATPSLTPHVISCRYSHVEREAGISDHSIVIVEIA